MIHLIALLCQALGLGVAAGLEPVLVPLVVAAAAHAGVIGLPHQFAPLSSFPVLALLGALLLLGARQRHFGLSPLFHLLRLPLALAAGALVVASQLPIHGDLALAALGGAVLAGLTHSVLASLHRLLDAVGQFPLLPSLATTLFTLPLAAVEIVAALVLLGAAMLAPALVPLLILLATLGALWLGLLAARAFGGKLVEAYGPFMAIASGWLRPPSQPSPPTLPVEDADWLTKPVDGKERLAGVAPGYGGDASDDGGDWLSEF